MGIRLVPIWLDMDGRHAHSCPPNFPALKKNALWGDRPAGRLAGWLASQQKVPPSPGLIIISIIIIVMIVKLLIISSISTISFIHICNMNDINNNIVRIYHNGGAIMVSA